MEGKHRYGTVEGRDRQVEHIAQTINPNARVWR